MVRKKQLGEKREGSGIGAQYQERRIKAGRNSKERREKDQG
jgi:hypothetical protein